MGSSKTFAVLVVDDNSRAADMMARSLQHKGYEARAAYGGAEALQAMDAVKPRVILIDLSMPVMPGEELAREVRRREPGITLVALSGVRGDTRAASESGFDYYLRKPVSAEVVLDLLAAERLRDHDDQD